MCHLLHPYLRFASICRPKRAHYKNKLTCGFFIQAHQMVYNLNILHRLPAPCRFPFFFTRRHLCPPVRVGYHRHRLHSTHQKLKRLLQFLHHIFCLNYFSSHLAKTSMWTSSTPVETHYCI